MTYHVQLLAADMVIDQFELVDGSDPDVCGRHLREQAKRGKNKRIIGRDFEYAGSMTGDKMISQRLLDRVRKFEREHKAGRQLS